ncbi:MAG TPA: prepilin-type N-terminal cleavage/methylation domain-containing protein [Gemmatimonadaceae bacterium]|jgi:prepilin-type N-terminal cleavage/methylation domain-containing protein
MTRIPRGVTLMELIIVLALLGIMAGVVGLTLHSARPVPGGNPALAAVAAARDSAIRTGLTVVMTVHGDGSPLWATAFPDGRVVADMPLGIDLLTGQHEHAR